MYKSESVSYSKIITTLKLFANYVLPKCHLSSQSKGKPQNSETLEYIIDQFRVNVCEFNLIYVVIILNVNFELSRGSVSIRSVLYGNTVCLNKQYYHIRMEMKTSEVNARRCTSHWPCLQYQEIRH